MTPEINQSLCYNLILSLPDKQNKANMIQPKFLTLNRKGKKWL